MPFRIVQHGVFKLFVFRSVDALAAIKDKLFFLFGRDKCAAVEVVDDLHVRVKGEFFKDFDLCEFAILIQVKACKNSTVSRDCVSAVVRYEYALKRSAVGSFLGCYFFAHDLEGGCG